MNAIEVGHAGRVAMLQAVFGGGEPEPPALTVSRRVMTPGLFDAVFG